MNNNKYLYNNKLYRKLLALASAFNAAVKATKPPSVLTYAPTFPPPTPTYKITTPDLFKNAPATEEDLQEVAVGMDFDLFCLVEVVKSILTKTETERYAENCIGFHDSEEEARSFLRSTVRALYRRQYDNELKQKLERVKEKNLQTFLDNFATMSFDCFTTELHKNVPNQTSKGMPQVVARLQTDKDVTVDLDKKLELLLVGRLGDDVWNNGAVNR